MSDHPLDTTEVSKDNIAELFAADTRDLDDGQLNRIIEEMRTKRHLWEQEESSAKRSGKRPNPAKGLNIEDLDLSL